MPMLKIAGTGSLTPAGPKPTTRAPSNSGITAQPMPVAKPAARAAGVGGISNTAMPKAAAKPVMGRQATVVAKGKMTNPAQVINGDKAKKPKVAAVAKGGLTTGRNSALAARGATKEIKQKAVRKMFSRNA